MQVWMKLHRVTYTRCHIDTFNSPDGGHTAVRNMQRTEVNIREKELCVKLVIYEDYNKFLRFALLTESWNCRQAAN